MTDMPVMAEDGWQALVSYLASRVDLDATARATRAFTYAHGVPSPTALLRLLLVYSATPLSLRGTAAWAAQSGVARLCDVSLLERLRNAVPWARLLVSKLLPAPPSGAPGRRLMVIDATTVSAPGPQGRLWRLHLGVDLAAGQLAHAVLTDEHEAERLSRCPLEPGDIALLDGGYAQAGELYAADQAGIGFICRLGWNAFSLQRPEGDVFDLLGTLRASTAKTVDVPVLIRINRLPGKPLLPVRLVARRLEPKVAARARQRAKRIARRKGHVMRPQTLEAAEWILTVTNLDASVVAADAVLDAYRFRWQVERYIKKNKSIQGLGTLSAREERLGQACLYGKLLMALLLDHLRHQSVAFSPSGPARPQKTLQPMDLRSIPVAVVDRRLALRRSSLGALAAGRTRHHPAVFL